MVNIYSLIFIFISIILPTISHSQTFTPPITYSSFLGTPNYIYTDLLSAEKSFAHSHATTNNYLPITKLTHVSTTGTQSNCTYNDKNGILRGAFNCALARQACPSGYSSSGSFPNISCTGACPVDTVLNSTTGICETPCQQLQGVTTKSYTYSSNSEPPQTVCKSGCLASATDLSICVLPKAGSTSANCFGTYKFNGSSCSASTDVPISTPTTEQDCIAKGLSYGTVNGTVVCVAKGTSGAAPTNQSSTGNSSTTTSTSNTTTTTSTTVTGDNVKTTTTTTNPDGTTSTETQEQDKTSFCEENPNLQLCKTSDFSGSCGTFTCNGDAIQCAISKEQHKRNCELFTNETSMTTDGKAIVNGTAPDNPAKVSNRETINVAGIINEGSNIGIGSFQDKNIFLAGGGLTLPFSKLNFIMQILGGFILAASYLNAARIVGVR